MVLENIKVQARINPSLALRQSILLKTSPVAKKARDDTTTTIAVFLKSLISLCGCSTIPARKRRRTIPNLETSSINFTFFIIPVPKGPAITPQRIYPIMIGCLNARATIESTVENIITMLKSNKKFSKIFPYKLSLLLIVVAFGVLCLQRDNLPIHLSFTIRLSFQRTPESQPKAAPVMAKPFYVAVFLFTIVELPLESRTCSGFVSLVLTSARPPLFFLFP